MKAIWKNTICKDVLPSPNKYEIIGRCVRVFFTSETKQASQQKHKSEREPAEVLLFYIHMTKYF